MDQFANAEDDAGDWDIPALQRELSQLFALGRRRLPRHRVRPAERRRAPRRAVGAHPGEVHREGTGRPARHPHPGRARHHAADRRSAVEGPPLLARSPQGRHRPARLRPARSAGRVQEGKLHAVPGHEGAYRRGDRPLSLVAAAGGRGWRHGPARAHPPTGGEAASPQLQQPVRGVDVGLRAQPRCGERRRCRSANSAAARPGRPG